MSGESPEMIGSSSPEYLSDRYTDQVGSSTIDTLKG